MTPDERDLITGLFDRMRSADTPDKDREAEDHIRRKIGEFPSAPYLLTQTVLVQEQALKGAEAHIAELEQRLADAQRANQPASSGGSFLSKVRRPWETPTPAPMAQPAPQAYAPPPPQAYAAPAPAGGGFLQSALSTAAGVAGGALLFQGIERLMGHGSSPFGAVSGSPWGATAPTENVTVNNYYGDEKTAEHQPQHDTADTQQVDYDDSGSDFDDSGSDFDDSGSDIV